MTNKVHTTTTRRDGSVWLTRCVNCDWRIVSVDEGTGEREGGFHEDDKWNG